MVTADPSLAADYVRASQFTLEELRSGLRGRSAKVAPALAAGLLAMREYPERLADLCGVLADPATPLQVRIAAAAAIGRLGDPAGTAALRAALSEPHPSLRAAVGKALGEGPPAARAPSEPSAAPAATRTQSIPVTVRAAEPGDLVDLARRQLAEALPSVPLEPAATHAFECRGRKFLLFRVRGVAGSRALARVKQERTIVAVVAGRYEYLAPGFAPRFLVEVGPGRGKNELDIRLLHGRRRSVIGQGSGRIERDTVRFHLRSLPLPAVPLMDIDGSWVRGDIVLERVSSATLQPAAVAPRPRPR